MEISRFSINPNLKALIAYMTKITANVAELLNWD